MGFVLQGRHYSPDPSGLYLLSVPSCLPPLDVLILNHYGLVRVRQRFDHFVPNIPFHIGQMFVPPGHSKSCSESILGFFLFSRNLATEPSKTLVCRHLELNLESGLRSGIVKASQLGRTSEVQADSLVFSVSMQSMLFFYVLFIFVQEAGDLEVIVPVPGDEICICKFCIVWNMLHAIYPECFWAFGHIDAVGFSKDMICSMLSGCRSRYGLNSGPEPQASDFLSLLF